MDFTRVQLADFHPSICCVNNHGKRGCWNNSNILFKTFPSCYNANLMTLVKLSRDLLRCYNMRSMVRFMIGNGVQKMWIRRRWDRALGQRISLYEKDICIIARMKLNIELNSFANKRCKAEQKNRKLIIETTAGLSWLLNILG